MRCEPAACSATRCQCSGFVAQGGIICNLSAKTSVIAAANPRSGHYDLSKTVCENLKIALPLLSRFDLVFILLDRPDEARDRCAPQHEVNRPFVSRGGCAHPLTSACRGLSSNVHTTTSAVSSQNTCSSPSGLPGEPTMCPRTPSTGRSLVRKLLN